MQLLLVDGNSLGHTSHHVGGPVFAGELQTQAVSGFIRTLGFKLSANPALTPFVVWDGKAHWRHMLHPAYKTSRSKTEEQKAAREAYAAQVPFLQRLLKHLGVFQVKAPNAEADDLGFQFSRCLIGTEHTVELYSSDTDWWQGIAANIHWQGVRKGQPAIYLSSFETDTGYVSPRAFIEGKALKGDTADDITGVPAVGEKTAAKILREFGSREGFYTAVEKGQVNLDKEIYKVMASDPGKALWEHNLRLMDLTRAPKLHLQDLQVVPGEINVEQFAHWCQELNLSSFVRWLDRTMEVFKAALAEKSVLAEIVNKF